MMATQFKDNEFQHRKALLPILFHPTLTNSASTVSKETWKNFSYSTKPGDTTLQPTIVQLAHTNSTLPFANATAILDIACGPGSMYTQLFASEPPIPLSSSATLTALDISPAMIAQIHQRQSEDSSSDKEWSRVTTHVCDATDLSMIPDSSQSHVLSALGIFVIPDSDAALREARRVMAPGGVFSMTGLASASWVQEVLAQLTILHPDRMIPFAAEKWRTKEAFGNELINVGFRDVEMVEIPLAMQFEEREQAIEWLWKRLAFMPTVTKGMSELDIKRAKEAMIEYIARTYPELPGTLPGLALLGVGR